MFITIRNQQDELVILNAKHIIRVKPIKINSYKIGEPDYTRTKIEVVGAMIGTEVVCESVEQVHQMIKEALND